MSKHAHFDQATQLSREDAKVCAELITLEMRCRELEAERIRLEEENSRHNRESQVAHDVVSAFKSRLAAVQEERQRVEENLASVRESLDSANGVIAEQRAHIAVKSVRELRNAEALAGALAAAKPPAVRAGASKNETNGGTAATTAGAAQHAPETTDTTTNGHKENPATIPVAQSGKSSSPTRNDSQQKEWYRSYFGLSALIAVTIGLGMFSDTLGGEPGAWYAALHKPSFTHPRWVFPVVWTVLYALMGSALWLVLRAAPSPQQQTAITLFWSQFLANFCFSIIFLRLHSLRGAALDRVALTALALLTVRQFHRVDRRAAWLLVPYALWLCVVTYEAVMIWALN